MASASTSESPVTDSAGEKLNTKSARSNYNGDLEFMTLYGDDDNHDDDGTVYSFDGEDEVEGACGGSQKFNFRLFHDVIDDMPAMKQKK